MAEATNAEIQERFESAGGNLEDDVLAELQSIMRLHSIDVEELWYKWESYSMKMGLDDMKLNIGIVDIEACRLRAFSELMVGSVLAKRVPEISLRATRLTEICPPQEAQATTIFTAPNVTTFQYG